MNGSEFVILIPNIDENNIKSLIENFLSKVYELEDLKKNKFRVCKYDNEESLKKIYFYQNWLCNFKQNFIQKRSFIFRRYRKIQIKKEEWITIINDS